jgi:hypothetical protein
MKPDASNFLPKRIIEKVCRFCLRRFWLFGSPLLKDRTPMAVSY